MKVMPIYYYFNSAKNTMELSLTPLPPTSCQIKYYLKANANHILVNSKTNQQTRGIIVPSWELNDWSEKGIND